MRALTKVRVLVGGTIAAGAAVIIAAPFLAVNVSIPALALLGAAVIVTELIQVPNDETSLDPGDAHSFSFSSGVHVAVILVIGPWTSAVIAALGVILVDGIRGSRWRHIVFNASVFALAAVSAGHMFKLAGGVPGTIDLPGDFPAFAALAFTYYAVNNVLMSAVVAFSSGGSFRTMSREVWRDGWSSAVGEIGLGFTLAFFVLVEPWAVIALAPFVLAVYRSYERLATLRRETARALETFANVVDERDAYTYRHSARVAEYVHSLASALELPDRAVRQFRWAGRLHDLGKITVDASVLRKPSKLDADEWASMRLHPRLSARLLRQFQLASDHARAVEYHHERFDGKGYYGVDSADLPLGAHFLIVADAYDAMTSDRPYRRGLPPETALAELESKAGTQFHPGVAKAFVALQRGEDPIGALTPEEYADLRRTAVTPRHRELGHSLRMRPELRPIGGLVAALLAVAAGWYLLAVPALLLGGLATAFNELANQRGRRLAGRLRAILSVPTGRDELFAGLATELGQSSGARWAGLVHWREREYRGALELVWSAGSPGPDERSLTSWFVRDVEVATQPLVATATELGYEHPCVAVPLRRDDALVGYLAVAVEGRVTRPLEEALASCADALADRLFESVGTPERPRLEAVAS